MAANDKDSQKKGTMSVSEAGKMGGETTSKTHSKEFYEEIGSQGGERVRELVEEGKEAEASKESGGTNKKRAA